MTLVAARGFSGGPMSDIDYGMVASSSAWVETAAALAVTQPNTGTRSVSIAAGWHDGFGIRQNNDAAITQALTAPSSGGAWYLIALRRDWAAKTCTLQVLAGPTTGGTTAPTTIPTSVPTDLKSTPGTQHDQPLAWAFVNSANTTVTLFDLRLVDTRARGLLAPSLQALAFLSSSMQDGAVVTVDRHAIPGTPAAMVHLGSVWVRQYGAFTLLNGSAVMVFGEAAGVPGLADMITFAAGLEALFTAFPSAFSAYNGMRLISGAGSEVRRQTGLGGNIVWKPWECSWVDFTPGMGGVAYNSFRSKIRVQGGRVKWHFDGTVTAQNNGAEIVLGGVPAVLYQDGTGNNPLPRGTAFWYANGVRIPTVLDFNGSGSLHFLVPPSSGNPRNWGYGVAGDVVGNGAAFFLDLEWDC